MYLEKHLRREKPVNKIKWQKTGNEVIIEMKLEWYRRFRSKTLLISEPNFQDIALKDVKKLGIIDFKVSNE